MGDKNKVKLANDLIQVIGKFTDTATLNDVDIKQIIMSMVMKVTNYVDLNNPIIQYGIDSVNAINFGSLENGISIQAKILWTAYMVSECKCDFQKSSEQLAKVLIEIYDEELDYDAIEFLNQKYGARKNVLEGINKRSEKTCENKLLDCWSLKIATDFILN